MRLQFIPTLGLNLESKQLSFLWIAGVLNTWCVVVLLSLIYANDFLFLFPSSSFLALKVRFRCCCKADSFMPPALIPDCVGFFFRFICSGVFRARWSDVPSGCGGGGGWSSQAHSRPASHTQHTPSSVCCRPEEQPAWCPADAAEHAHATAAVQEPAAAAGCLPHAAQVSRWQCIKHFIWCWARAIENIWIAHHF